MWICGLSSSSPHPWAHCWWMWCSSNSIGHWLAMENLQKNHNFINTDNTYNQKTGITNLPPPTKREREREREMKQKAWRLTTSWKCIKRLKKHLFSFFFFFFYLLKTKTKNAYVWTRSTLSHELTNLKKKKKKQQQQQHKFQSFSMEVRWFSLYKLNSDFTILNLSFYTFYFFPSF